MSFNDWWLDFIEDDIKEKYSIKDPIFTIHKKILSREEVIAWLNNYETVSVEERWIKYKHLSENYFELKSFFPDPPDQVCKERIDVFLKGICSPCSVQCTHSLCEKNTFFKIGKFVYTYKQIEKHLIYELNLGYSELYAHLDKVNSENERLIIGIDIMQTELYWFMQTGLVVLEYKD